jgi:hypothetical protein
MMVFLRFEDWLNDGVFLGLKKKSGGELLKIQLPDNQLVDTFVRKSTARHKIYQLLKSS